MKDDITNPLSIVSKKTRTEIVRAALKYDKKALADFYSRDVGGFFPGFSHAKNVPDQALLKQLCEDVVEHIYLASLAISIWVKTEEKLRETVGKRLEERGYKLRAPKQPLLWKTLSEEDRIAEDKRIYFVPGGDAIEGEDREKVTVMALALGWYDDTGHGEFEDIDIEEKEISARVKDASVTQMNESTSNEALDIPTLEGFRNEIDRQRNILKKKLPAAETFDLSDLEEIDAILKALVRQFGEIREKLLDQAVSGEIQGLPPVADIKTMAQLGAIQTQLLESRNARDLRVNSNALQTLEELRRLVNTVDRDFKPIQEVHRKIDSLLDLLRGKTDEARIVATSIADGSHPYMSLLKLVKERDQLAYDQIARLQTDVARAFGAEMAAAAVLPRLVIEETKKAIPQPELIDGKTPSRTMSDNSEARSAGDRAPEEKLDPATPDLDSIAAKPNTTPIPPQVQSFDSTSERKPTLRKRSDSGTNLSEMELANDLLSRETFYDHLADLDHLLWIITGTRKYALAYQLSKAMEANGLGDGTRLAPSMLSALALGQHISKEDGEIADILKGDYDKLAEYFRPIDDTKVDIPIRMLMAAATMRPSLVAPLSNAPSLLAQVSLNNAPSVNQYCEKISAFGNLGRALDRSLLEEVKDKAAEEKELYNLTLQVNQWLAQAPTFTFLYPVAGKVWRKLLQREHSLQLTLSILRDNQISQADKVIAFVSTYTDETKVRKEIDRLHRVVHPIQTSEPIVAKAYGQLQRHIREAVGFSKQWLELVGERDAGERTFYHDEANRLRTSLEGLYPACQQELAAIGGDAHQESHVRVAASVLMNAIENLRTLLSYGSGLGLMERDPNILLGAPLLLIDETNLDFGWQPRDGYSIRILRNLLTHIRGGIENWVEAFNKACEQHDHLRSSRILEVLPLIDADTHKIDLLRERFDEKLVASREFLKRLTVRATQPKIDEAMALNLLREAEYLNYRNAVETILRNFDSSLDLASSLATLTRIDTEIEGRKGAERERILKRMASQKIDSSHSYFSRITALVENGEFLTAEDYINRAIQKEELPTADGVVDHFQNFMTLLSALNEFLQGANGGPAPNTRQIIQDIRKCKNIGPVVMSGVPEAQADQAADMVEAWTDMKRQKGAHDTNIQTVFECFGFNVHEVKRNVENKRDVFHVKTEPLQDKARCPAFRYGSEAGGSYRVITMWDQPTEDFIVSEAGILGSSPPLFVFHFGRMSEMRRRGLAAKCRELRRTLLLIDDSVIYYLCGVRGDRASVLFDTTLPLTFLEPYVTTASLVPPEVFYGRSRESSQIKDPYGSCFIYGGRQLGKTALLRSVQAEYNDPERGKIAVYVDLKTEGVGLARPNDYLWEILIREFKRLEVLPSRLPFNAGLDRLVGSLKEWIGASPDRRILLLLDEADNFLESDAKLGLKSGARTEYFGSTSRLKGLMDGTNRRFKVVFAGLHNVQRTTTLSNHPLAHFGEPICIGPLLTDGEWREAKKLIEVPMGSIGYRFASVDSITHILSQTNYYPSLIQLCCQQLLNHMRNIPFDFKTSPPYKVEERHVEDALHNENLRKQLRDRFLWTLQLDPRYEVIAYTIGWLNLSDPLGYGIEGYSVEGLRQQALYFWEKGFQDNTTTDSIRVLLDEMVGLGVLQALPGDRYNLRNQNVLRLMGSEDEIIRNLDRPREAPLLYEPAHLRGVFKRDQEEVFRSPLTVQQESEMLSRQSGTTILFGCNASGLDDVAGYFGQHDAISTEILRGTASRAEFERNLNRFMGLQKNQTLLVIVPETCPWSLDWVGLTLRHTAKMRNEKSFLRFVFLAGPNRTLMICCQEWEEFEILKHNALHTLSLQKWHDSCLRQWLDEEKYMLSVEERGQLIDSTGGWYRPLQMFYSMTKNSPHHWRTGLNQLEEQIRSDKQNQLMEFGISEVTNRARTMLNAMAEYGEAMTVEEIASVGPVSDSIPQVMQSIVWAELLGLVELQSVGHYRLESFVRRLLL